MYVKVKISNDPVYCNSGDLDRCPFILRTSQTSAFATCVLGAQFSDSPHKEACRLLVEGITEKKIKCKKCSWCLETFKKDTNLRATSNENFCVELENSKNHLNLTQLLELPPSEERNQEILKKFPNCECTGSPFIVNCTEFYWVVLSESFEVGYSKFSPVTIENLLLNPTRFQHSKIETYWIEKDYTLVEWYSTQKSTCYYVFSNKNCGTVSPKIPEPKQEKNLTPNKPTTYFKELIIELIKNSSSSMEGSKIIQFFNIPEEYWGYPVIDYTAKYWTETNSEICWSEKPLITQDVPNKQYIYSLPRKKKSQKEGLVLFLLEDRHNAIFGVFDETKKQE
jgi:hypothetical protein